VKRRDPAALKEATARSRFESEPDWLSGSCLLARKEALDAVGGFDEGFFLYEEDVDLCLRLRRAGWGVLFMPDAEVVHHLGRSMQTDPARARLEYHRSHLRFYRKHNGSVLAAALRGLIGAEAALGWLRSVGPGPGRRRRRRHHAQVLRVAIGFNNV
jgi:GT2 family glycosyltransferase